MIGLDSCFGQKGAGQRLLYSSTASPCRVSKPCEYHQLMVLSSTIVVNPTQSQLWFVAGTAFHVLRSPLSLAANNSRNSICTGPILALTWYTSTWLTVARGAFVVGELLVVRASFQQLQSTYGGKMRCIALSRANQDCAAADVGRGSPQVREVPWRNPDGK